MKKYLLLLGYALILMTITICLYAKGVSMFLIFGILLFMTFIISHFVKCEVKKPRWYKTLGHYIGTLALLVIVQAAAMCLYDNHLNVQAFEQKVVLITGSASGIGKATAEHLLDEGYIVYGGDIATEKNQWMLEAGGTPLDMDVTSPDMVQAGVDKIIDEQGRIDVLFNNAGYGLFGTVEEVSLEDGKAQFDVNFFGYTNLIKAVMPHMREQGDGLVINNSSMGGRLYTPLGAWYHGTKYAVEAMSDALRYEVAHFGVDVVLVEPGLINTNFYNVAGGAFGKYGPTSAYQHIYGPIFENTDGLDTSSFSDPSVIAETVEEAIRAKKPKLDIYVDKWQNSSYFLEMYWVIVDMIGLQELHFRA